MGAFLGLISIEYLISIGLFTAVITPNAIKSYKNAGYNPQNYEVSYISDSGENETICVSKEEVVFYNTFGEVVKQYSTRAIHKGHIIFKGGELIIRKDILLNGVPIQGVVLQDY